MGARRRHRPVVRAALVGCSVLLGVAGVAVLGLQVGVLAGWWRVVPVLSGSMAPAMPAGAAAIVTPVPSGAVEVGDILVFNSPTPDRTVLAHRVTRVVETGSGRVLHTRGDANEREDDFQFRIVGDEAWRVRWIVPEIGFLANVSGRPAVRFAILALVVGVAARFALGLVWGRRPLAPVRSAHEPASRADVSIMGSEPRHQVDDDLELAILSRDRS